MRHMKQLTAAVLSLGLAASVLSGCGGNPTGGGGEDESVVKFPIGTKVVGIAMSGSEDAAAEQLKTTLEDAGYGVVLSYAGEDSNTQITQLNEMLESGSSILVLDAVDATAVEQWFSGQVDSASETEEELPFQVIACDTYLSSGPISAYIGPDYKAMGAAQGEYLLTELGLNSENPPANALTIEFVAGDTEVDQLIFDSAMEVLSPYLTDGKLVVPSGNTTYEAVSAQGAAAYTSSLLTTTYSANNLEIDAIVTTSGAVVEEVLEEMQALYTGSVYPIITSARCDLASAQYLRTGFLAMTTVSPAFPEDWAAQAAALVQQLADGKEVSDVLTAPVTVSSDNFDEALIQSGLYAYDDADQLVEGDGIPLPVDESDEDGGAGEAQTGDETDAG